MTTAKATWLVFLVVRAVWTFMPQMGYIHPDEFFQTVEVVAGDALNVSVIRTWEFTGMYPMRSVVLPKLLFHPVFVLFKTVLDFNNSDLTGYTVLLASRLVMLLLSFLIDIFIFRICRMIGLQGYTTALIYASSYVTLTFQSHSFSNSIETVLVAGQFYVLILLIKAKLEHEENKEIVNESNSLKYQKDELLDEKRFLTDLHENAFRSPRLRGKLKHDVAKLELSSSIRSGKTEDLKENIVKEENKNVIKGYKINNKEIYPIALLVLLGSILAFGVFNRPTFLVFGCVPFLWWMDIYNRMRNYRLQLTTIIMSGFVTSVILITCDSLYYMSGKIINIQDIGVKQLLQIFTITPMNFVIYNTNSSNLEKHGRHPFYLHLMVNLPLLLGPLLIPVWSGASLQISGYYFTKTSTTSHRHSGDTPQSKMSEDSAAVKNGSELSSEGRSKRSNNESEISADNLTTSESTMFDFVDSKSASEHFSGLCRGNENVKAKLRQALKHNLLLYIYIPVILLSLFPHQEPRFLIPVVPAAVLFTSLIGWKRMGCLFWTSFFCFNVGMTTVFGVLHQGGVIPCLMHLQKISTVMKTKDLSKSELTLAFSHTYMPPKHILLDRNNFINLVDFKGKDLAKVCLCLKGDSHYVSDGSNCEDLHSGKTVYFAITGTVASHFKEYCEKYVGIRKVRTFFPHISFEDLPNFSGIKNLNMLVDQLSLHLYEITIL